MTNVLDVVDLHKSYGRVNALSGVSLSVARGECVGVVGESGSGKSTLARCLLTLEKPSSGQVSLNGEPVTGLRGAALKQVRQKMQVVFQNPSSSFNSKVSIFRSLMEPLRSRHRSYPSFISGGSPRDVAEQLLELVHLPGSYLDRYPHELSGGEKQRIAIARALSVEPQLIIFDEPTSSLDVSIQARILNLLLDLKDSLKFSSLFISHDLSAVQFMSERSIVLRAGVIVDHYHRRELFEPDRDVYTQELVRLFEVSS